MHVNCNGKHKGPDQPTNQPTNMERYKSWFYASNNNYFDFTINNPLGTSSSSSSTGNSNINSSTTANGNVSHHYAQSDATTAATPPMRTLATSRTMTASSGGQSKNVASNHGIGRATYKPNDTTAYEQAPSSVHNGPTLGHLNVNVNANAHANANVNVNANANANANTNTNSATTTTTHMVTFLEDSPRNSNGMVTTTTSRIATSNEMQQHAHILEHHSNLDAIEREEQFIAASTAGVLSFCEESVPPAKNCYRLIMLGSPCAGKSSIVARFMGKHFEDAYIPTIEDYHRKLYRIRNEVYQLDITDTSGHHPNPAMRRVTYLTGDLFVLVFSMDSRESFEEVIRLREDIMEVKLNARNARSGFKKKNAPKIPMLLAGNKCDIELRKLQLDEIMGYVAGQDDCCAFVECSARQNHGIEDIFCKLFMAANLPIEMAPNQHRQVANVFGAPTQLPPHNVTTGAKKTALSMKRRFSDACGVVVPNIRRPSIRTELNLMRTKKGGTDVDGPRPSRCRQCTLM